MQTQPIQRRHYKQITCTCAAYAFPHRFGSGSCCAPDPVHASERRPSCSDCRHSITMKDPYGTGDSWFSLTDCTLDYCPLEGK